MISDTVKQGAAEAIHKMKNVGVKKCVMLTGDREKTAKHVADELKLDEVHAELLPGDKVDEVEKLLSAQKDGERLAFVGDGINDAPVLTRADIGIAMGSLGSDAAIEAADVVLMDDDIRKIASTVLISENTSHCKAEHCICPCRKSSCTFAWCNWCGEYVGSCICRCRCICFGNFELNVGDEKIINMICIFD